ncbi:conserved Plasmodium protein, unknown function [Plasmodium chabaudi chabaudi]|uniref:Uncharacterized protein n=1 Tax=Plasmodium chabaudi chabaudi TaxID=31271 RepID=A0A1C6XN93_PLACU|nr:conserved Plasmodium protein, unknown function [Plasmodium chabaudi chabaudi]
MSSKGSVEVSHLIEERDKWIEKYEKRDSEYLVLKQQLEDITKKYNKTKGDENEEMIKKDIALKYNHMETQCKFLNVQVNILILEKEKEIKKNKELEIIINKQNKEINCYKQILEKLKNLNISFKKKKEEAETKMHVMIDNDLVTKNDHSLLKGIIKINDKLIDVNNKVHSKINIQLEKTVDKLSLANKKIKKYYEAINNMNENFLKYKKEKEKMLLETLKINQELREQLEKKKYIEKYNNECKFKLEQFVASNILLNYYQSKWKLTEYCMNLLLKFISSVNGINKNGWINTEMSTPWNDHNAHHFSEESKLPLDSYNLFSVHVEKKEGENSYIQYIEAIKKNVLSNNFSEIKIKKIDLSASGIVLNDYKHKELDYLDKYILTNNNSINSLNIIQVLYCNIKIIHDIFECANIAFQLLLYIYETYLKEVIDNLHNPSYLENLEKSSIRFSIYFFMALSYFLLYTQKYIQIIKGSNIFFHFVLLYDKKFSYIYSLCRYLLEEYMEKIRIKLFNQNVDYSMLQVLTEKLVNFYHSLRGEKEENRWDEMEEKIEDEDDINKQNINEKEKEKEIKWSEKEENKMRKETISSIEIICFLNTITAASILLIIDKAVYTEFYNYRDINIQKQIIEKCEETLKLIKMPQNVLNFYCPIKQFNFSSKKFVAYATKYKLILVNMIDDTMPHRNDEKKKNSKKNEKNIVDSTSIDRKSSAIIQSISQFILEELENVFQKCSTHSLFVKKKQDELLLIQICNKYVEMYNLEISKENKNNTKHDIDQKNDIIKNYEQELNGLKNLIDTLNKKISILSIREEKYNKIKIDLDIYKKEKNEYVNIINDLRKTKSEALNQITYITKQKNEIKNKYNELLKNHQKKNKLNEVNTKHMESSNIDIYYMKKIINNLYNENFINKINKQYYYLFDDKINYYNNKYEKDGHFFNFLHTHDEIKKDEIYDIREESKKSFDNFLTKTTQPEEIHETQINSDLNNFFSKDIYFVDKKHTEIYDDIYNCELIKSRLSMHKTEYFKNKLYNTNFSHSFIPNHKKNNNWMQEIIHIIQKYKNLKNEVYKEILNVPINLNNDKTVFKKNMAMWNELYYKVIQIQNLIKQFCIKNNLKNTNHEISHLNNVLNIIIGNDINTESPSDLLNNKNINDIKISNNNNNKNYEYSLNTNTCVKTDVILNDSAFSYLIKNIFDFSTID